MKRIEKIYQYVKEQTKNLTPMTLTSDAGVTTQEISERLNIQRTNASKDLNQLVREGRLKKLSGRQVKPQKLKIFSKKLSVQLEA